MMATRAQDKFAQRFLGDTVSKVVHDVDHEDPTASGCGLEELVASGNAVRFDPDRLRTAAEEGYTNCPKCLYRYDTRRGLLQQLLYDPLKEELKAQKKTAAAKPPVEPEK